MLGPCGSLGWEGKALVGLSVGRNENGARVEDGADSYLIRDSKIRVMTIHYTVIEPGR